MNPTNLTQIDPNFEPQVNFCRSVNPISTRGDKFCTSLTTILATPIFSPSGITGLMRLLGVDSPGPILITLLHFYEFLYKENGGLCDTQARVILVLVTLLLQNYLFSFSVPTLKYLINELLAQLLQCLAPSSCQS